MAEPKSALLLGEHISLSGSEDDAYYAAISTGQETADSVVTGILPHVPPRGVCIDVGANLGLYSIALARRFPRARVYSIEPVPQTFAHLRANLRRNAPSCVPLQYACGAADGTATIQFARSFSAGSHFVDGGSLATSATTGAEAVEITVRTLDGLVAELDLPSVDLVKIDVEGYELDVLEGASAVLSRWRPLAQIEFNSWTLLAHRRVLPQDAIERICATFPYVYVHERHGPRLAAISDDVDVYRLLFANVVHHRADNLLCASVEVAPDAPPFAEVMPSFIGLHEDGSYPSPGSTGERLAIAEATLAAMRASRSWRSTRPLRWAARQRPLRRLRWRSS